MKTEFDAVVVGSGPNGLSAAITLAEAGLSVLLIEAKNTVGGGLRSSELTLPGFVHDICSAIHPLAANSPVFSNLHLENYGLEYIYPPFSLAHPFDDGSTVALENSVEKTALQFDEDAQAYEEIFTALLKEWKFIRSAFLGPLHFSGSIFKATRFVSLAASSALYIAHNNFTSSKARAFFAGMAAHSMLPLNKVTTSAVALILMISGHHKGWPVVKGGSQKMAEALAKCFISSGGKIETGFNIASLNDLPSSKVVLFDLGPKQLLQIARNSFSKIYKWQLRRYQYGMGVFKIDWALSEPVPFTANQCRQAATVHLGNSLHQIMLSEETVWKKKHSEHPFVIFAQPTIIDPSRAPKDKHTAWAYCHVPNGSTISMTDIIEKQVERFAPGFRDCILNRHSMNTTDLQDYNPNYLGGDINGGMLNLTQLFTRPALRFSPYSTSSKRIYICSASTPPGGGVHGICGYYAARRALKDHFNLHLPML